MAEDEAKALSDAKQMPFPERVAHKHWKVRSEAFDDIKASCQSIFSDEDPVLSQYCEACLLCRFRAFVQVCRCIILLVLQATSLSRAWLIQMPLRLTKPWKLCKSFSPKQMKVMQPGRKHMQQQGHVQSTSQQHLCNTLGTCFKSLLVGLYRIAGPVCNTLASKVLKQRPGTVQRAKDVYLMFCELEQAEAVVVSLPACMSGGVT